MKAVEDGSNGIIVKSNAGLYDVYLVAEKRIVQAKSRGILRHQDKQPMVGDHVLLEQLGDEQMITAIAPRKNQLIRPFIANIDICVIVISVKEPAFQQYLLDKYLSLLEFNQIAPIIVFTKYDLLSPKETKQFQITADYYQKIGYSCFLVSDKHIQDKARLNNLLAHKIATIMGQTGVGKTTLLNDLSNNEWQLKTNAISKALGRGKHTTRIVELFPINNYWLADTPGFSSFSLQEIPARELTGTFIEFADYPCHFNNCVHINEKECGVKAALKTHKILSARYKSYRKLFTELQTQEDQKKW